MNKGERALQGAFSSFIFARPGDNVQCVSQESLASRLFENDSRKIKLYLSMSSYIALLTISNKV